MRRLIGPTVVAVAAAVLLAEVRAGEEKLSLDKVPKAVMKAVNKKFPGAKILGASSEKEKDKTVYEISLTYKKHHHDVTVETDGKIVSIERTISAKALPKAVRKAISAKYPKATYKRVEELIKGDGTLHAYEALLLTADKNSVEVVLDKKGNFLKEEKTKKKDKGD
jgi:hypothetical protein